MSEENMVTLVVFGCVLAAMAFLMFVKFICWVVKVRAEGYVKPEPEPVYLEYRVSEWPTNGMKSKFYPEWSSSKKMGKWKQYILPCDPPRFDRHGLNEMEPVSFYNIKDARLWLEKWAGDTSINHEPKVRR